MASAALQAVIDQLRANPIPADADLAVLCAAFPDAPAPEGTRVTSVEAGGIRGEWVVADHAAPDRRLLYLHGGGYVICSPATHRDLAGRLSQAAQVSVPRP
jgi:monoterpene epsilon-lactone hydrolase